MLRFTLIKFQILCVAFACALTAGCFGEKDCPAIESQLSRLPPQAPPLLARQWTAATHHALRSLLPFGKQQSLTTDELLTDGKTVDIFRTMRLNPEHLDSLFLNFEGIQQSAQVTSREPDDYCADWPEFESISIPVTGGDQVCARLAKPLKNDLGKSFIVFTHGLFGSMSGLDVRNQLTALRNAGHHVLALELRGHGATHVRFPKQSITFGILEAPDLLAVARWLKSDRGANRVGLVSFSMTAFAALQAAWMDGGGLAEERFFNMPLFRGIPAADAAPAFNAGMLLISPPVNFLETGETFDTERNYFNGAVHTVFQTKVAARLTALGKKSSYKMWDFAAVELERAVFGPLYGKGDLLKKDANLYFDLRAGDWAEGRRRLERVRAPLLILEAANDPLGTAQAVVDLVAPVKNPHCAAIILAQGGHMGFPAVSADYYYSLMLNFFDPQTGPATQAHP
jgi:predicted alpha/beta-fold hydrolase